MTLDVRPAGLGLHVARLPEFPAGDELLRPAGQRRRLLPAGPSCTARCVNRLPYSQSGRVADGCAPKWAGGRTRLVGLGPALRPLPGRLGLCRSAAPGRAAGVLLPAAARELAQPDGRPTTTATTGPTARFAPATAKPLSRPRGRSPNTFAERGWNDTLFQCYLNNKVDFKRGGWSRGSSPWLLDEPANFQDYWALRYFGEAFHDGAGAALGRPAAGRPSWSSAPTSRGPSGNAIRSTTCWTTSSWAATPSAATTAWCSTASRRSARSWSTTARPTPSSRATCSRSAGASIRGRLGSDGVVPWQTIGRHESWQQADPLSLFYPGSFLRPEGARAVDSAESLLPRPAGRGVPDALAQVTVQPRWAVGQAVRAALRLKAEHQLTGLPGR